MAFELASQLIFVVRLNLNPLLTKYFNQQNFSSLLKLSRISTVGMGAVMAFGFLIAYLLFPIVVTLIFDDPVYLDAAVPLNWLFLSLIIASGILSFNMILTQCGKPEWHSLYMIVTLIINIIANAFLVPALGIAGAALGTCIAVVASGFLLILMARLLLGVRLLF